MSIGVPDEELIIDNNFIISESYGPQHSLKTIKSYFKLNDSEIRNYYTHKVRISYKNKYLVYDIDKDEKIASTIDFDKEAIEQYSRKYSISIIINNVIDDFLFLINFGLMPYSFVLGQILAVSI